MCGSLSTESSSLPPLELRIGSSRVRLALLTAFALAETGAVILLADKGYPALALLLTPALIRLLWMVVPRDSSGAVLYWRAGLWQLEVGGHKEDFSLLGHNCRMPWVVSLDVRRECDSRRATLWLFADAVDRESMRRLRLLLALLPQRCESRPLFGVSTVSRASGRVSG